MSELVLKDVKKAFGGKTIISGFSYTFMTGHCYALLGRNGVGKSTLINVIMQRCNRNGGTISIDGKKVDNNDLLLSRMFCMNDSAIYPNSFTVKTIINITASMYPGFDKAYSLSLADKFGLDVNKRLGQLSTGYTTVCKVILALSSNADFIFLDEPVLGLDVNLRELFYSELARICALEKSCFVISTHIINEIQDLIDTVIILSDKKILLSDTSDNLLSQYSSVSGKAELVDSFAAGKELVGTECMGSYKTAILKFTEEESLPDGLSYEALTLQKLFYSLTGGMPDEAQKRR